MAMRGEHGRRGSMEPGGEDCKDSEHVPATRGTRRARAEDGGRQTADGKGGRLGLRMLIDTAAALECAATADELQLDDGDDALAEEAVDDIDRDPERLREKVVTEVHLEEPIDERLTHVPSNFVLARHVFRVRHHGNLSES